MEYNDSRIGVILVKKELENKINKISEKYKIKNWQQVLKYEGGYIGKKTYIITYLDGSMRMIDRITKNNHDGDAVIIVPITEDNKFVMVVESRPNALAEVAVEFPAGMVDEGEEPLQVAKRELLEETGYTCDDICEIENHHQDQGCSRAVIRIYLATGCRKTKDIKTDGEERLESLEMSYEEVLDMVKNSTVEKIGINDSGSKLAFMVYNLKYKNK